MKRLIVALALAFVTVLGMGGVTVGETSAAPSKIVPGRYSAKYVASGVVPMPNANARIVGRTLMMDYYGTGSPRTYVYTLTPTKRGMIASYARDEVSKWYFRIDFRQTRNGYRGVIWNWGGIPVADLTLTKR